jgi:hypothetical protein
VLRGPAQVARRRDLRARRDDRGVVARVTLPHGAPAKATPPANTNAIHHTRAASRMGHPRGSSVVPRASRRQYGFSAGGGRTPRASGGARARSPSPRGRRR